jgi:CrcB protein
LRSEIQAALQTALWVGCGGFAGSILRYGLSGLVQRQLPLSTFPYGTLAVNLTGCLLIGWIAGLAETRQILGPGARAFVLVGVLGSFTTFSTFGYETLALVRESEHARAAANVLAHVSVGLVAVWLGHALAAR